MGNDGTQSLPQHVALLELKLVQPVRSLLAILQRIGLNIEIGAGVGIDISPIFLGRFFANFSRDDTVGTLYVNDTPVGIELPVERHTS